MQLCGISAKQCRLILGDETLLHHFDSVLLFRDVQVFGCLDVEVSGFLGVRVLRLPMYPFKRVTIISSDNKHSYVDQNIVRD